MSLSTLGTRSRSPRLQWTFGATHHLQPVLNCRPILALLLVIAGLLWLTQAWGAVATQAASVPAALTGEFKVFVPGTNELVVILEGRDRVIQLAAGKSEERQQLAHARAGDVITIQVDDAVEPENVNSIVAIQRPVSGWFRSIAMGIALVLAVGAASIALQSRPQQLAIGLDNRYSNSQTQLVAWTLALTVVYLATIFLRIFVLGPDYVGGVGITANLAALSGLSALSFGGAKTITVAKLDKQALEGGPSTKTRAERPDLLRDLFTNDKGVADLGDFQMIAITVLAVVIFLVTAFHWLHLLTLSPSVTLPDVDTSLLAGFGIGQGAYLAKKAAGRVEEG